MKVKERTTCTMEEHIKRIKKAGATEVEIAFLRKADEILKKYYSKLHETKK